VFRHLKNHNDCASAEDVYQILKGLIFVKNQEITKINNDASAEKRHLAPRRNAP